MSRAVGGTFGGLEELVKLVKLGIGQKVLGIWNWAFDKNYKPRSARTAPLRSSGGGGFTRLRAFRRASISGKWFVGLWGCGLWACCFVGLWVLSFVFFLKKL